MTIREVADLAGCRAVVDIQREVWGDLFEIVHPSVLKVSALRGGILLGAFDVDEMIGFVWSMPGTRDGVATQWSHMLGVRPAWRKHGTGQALKLAQRERALTGPADLIEWTFDPLQAPNAHLNLSRLGAVASMYWPDAYGSLDGPLHRGTPTDRLVAEWWIREPHVTRRVAALAKPTIAARSADVLSAPSVLETSRSGEWLAYAGPREVPEVRRVLLPVPPRFVEMQRDAPELASAWRVGARDAFQTWFGEGYRALDFLLDRATGGGSYVLVKDDTDAA